MPNFKRKSSFRKYALFCFRVQLFWSLVDKHPLDIPDNSLSLRHYLISIVLVICIIRPLFSINVSASNILSFHFACLSRLTFYLAAAWSSASVHVAAVAMKFRFL